MSFGTPAFGSAAFAGLPFVGTTVATGFTSTTFGTPLGLFSQFGHPVGAAPSTTFGSGGTHRRTQPVSNPGLVTVFGLAQAFKRQLATGFSTTSFGHPRVYPPHAVGFRLTQFGSVAGHQSWTADSLGVVTQFSNVYTPAPQSAQVDGFTETVFGSPFEIQHKHTTPIGRTAETAAGFQPTAFGHPAAPVRRTSAATGFSAGTRGTPRAMELVHPPGLHAGSFGTPVVHATTRGAGARATAFGTARARMLQTATNLYRAPRFGLPTVTRSHTYLTYGIDAAGRLGHPTATQRHNHPTTGSDNTHFGTPAAYERHRVATMTPATTFGTPLLKRNAQC